MTHGLVSKVLLDTRLLALDAKFGLVFAAELLESADESVSGAPWIDHCAQDAARQLPRHVLIHGG